GGGARPPDKAPSATAVADMAPRSNDTGQSPGPVPVGRVRATPLVRRLADELGVDLSTLQGTGPPGRAVEADVRAAAMSSGGMPSGGMSPQSMSGGQSPGHGPKGPGAEGRRERLHGVRRLIAEHMARAHREVPPVTWVEECDFSHIDLKLL